MGGWHLRMTWGQEVCYASLHNGPASALGLLTLWSFWANGGMFRCWKMSSSSYLVHCLSQILMLFETNTTFLRIFSWLQSKNIPDSIGFYFLIKHNQSAMLCYYIPPKTQGEFIFSAIVHTTLCRWCLSPTWKKTVTQWIEILSKGAILFWCYCVFTRYLLSVHTDQKYLKPAV